MNATETTNIRENINKLELQLREMKKTRNNIILGKVEEGISISKISKDYGVSRQTVYNILKGKVD